MDTIKTNPSSGVAAPSTAVGWAMETMMMINKLTPDIKGKAFNPDWFLLRERLGAIEARVLRAEGSGDGFAEARPK